MYADVLTERKNKQLDQTFTYQIPKEMISSLSVGKRVLVPFGHQELEGYVLKIHNHCEIETKEILDILDDEPVLNEEMIELGKYIQSKTLASLSSCYAAMLPKALKASKKTNIHKKIITYLKLTKNKEDILNEISNLNQKDIIELFIDNNPVLKSKANQISTSGVKTLIKNGYLIESDKEVYRYHLEEEEKEDKKILNDEQQQALNIIMKEQDEAHTYLLHGVTGSGKTEIYLQCIEGVLKNHKTALVLVPEISLTPQFVNRFSKRFPGKIAVLHSALSDGERYDEQRKILKGEASIVIGARSAIFAPLNHLGIIILDEEHSESYKQDNSPRYSTIDVAIKRSETHHCPLVLGSATPTLFSMARALKGVYTYIPLKKRINGNELPTCTIVDMSDEVKNKHSIISRELEYKIIEKLNKKEQILLLLNRRGYSTTITCTNCGYTYKCPHCDITLTYHKTTHNLRCHYCGYTKYIDDTCPNCHEKSLNYYGLGTEKLEDYIANIFPTAKIMRMDADVTSKKGMYQSIIKDFYEHKYDILLGTQMISKGLDFPDVSLVGILNADSTLNIPDYRSNENCFDLLYQASGRAGRSKTTGEVIIQTFYPNNYILQCVKDNDYMKFYHYEMNIRKTLKYPPFYYLVQLTLSSKEYELVSKEAVKVKEYLNKHVDQTSIVLGPSTSNQFKINGIYHFELLIKYRYDNQLMNTLKELDHLYLLNKKVNLDIDFIS